MEAHVNGIANKIRYNEEKRGKKRNTSLENINLLSDPAVSSTRMIRVGIISNTISNNIQSDIFKDRKMKRARIDGPDSSTDQRMISAIPEVSSEISSLPLLVLTTPLQRLFLNRSNLVKINKRLKEDSLRIEKRIQAISEALEGAIQTIRMLAAKLTNTLFGDFKNAKRRAEEIQDELSSLRDVDILDKNSYCPRLIVLGGLYKRLEEISSVLKAIRQIENHQSSVLSFASVFENRQISVLSSASVLVQEALGAEKIRVENLQKEYGCLMVQIEEIKARQEDVKKQIDKEKFKMDRKSLRQKQFNLASEEILDSIHN
ncbi:uncharacterized protein LOC136041583 isoform X2 [Artemia franciscana]|uniref:Uncharacterized protein n=2 Tax=Artemia franciscana TaxID=6661 RepID=A0AA88H3D4_ARTSF|nr:hypothetical protein QYM36_017897 [Artemia franciscana]